MHDKTDQDADLRADPELCVCMPSSRRSGARQVLWQMSQSSPSRSCGALRSHLSLNESHLLRRCRGEQNQSDQNGYEAAALWVCITHSLV